MADAVVGYDFSRAADAIAMAFIFAMRCRH